MDSSFNINDYYNNDNFIGEEDFIRQPDKPLIDRLIEDTRNNEEKELDEIMYQSLQEFHKMNEDHERNLIDTYKLEVELRKGQFNEFTSALLRISKYDNDVKEVYDIVEPIIETYCMSFIETCELDEITYDKVFATLSTIRVNKQSIELLRSIIVK